ncbi:hypothetical protein OBBRIDRAFT_796757 [Obba rivulosa]|uniref:F-box domain-containing protein n=1 Tax=Obba rivulosa TaxID=1052685 RepID=A0A8E2AP80_9APHY|nr:hypothetical protein OBBRIDRAFT_796757 [Obba rivulosa]
MVHATAVLNYDTLRNIFEHTWQHDSGVYDRKTLAHVARASRLLSEPAMDVLWSRLDGLHPLIRLLFITDAGEAVENVQIPSADNSEQSFLSSRYTIPERAWSRFQRSARRVKFLAYDERADKMNPAIFSALSDRAHNDTIFPSLCEILWCTTIPCNLEFANFLIPQLRVLRVSLHLSIGINSTLSNDPETQGELLQVLHPRCQNIEILTLDGHIPESWDVLSQFQNLKTLSLFSILLDDVAMSTFASSEILQNLNIDLPWTDYSAVNIPNNNSAFKALRRLDMASNKNDWRIFSTFLRYISSTELAFLRIRHQPSIRIFQMEDYGGPATLHILNERWAYSLTEIAIHVRDCFTIEVGLEEVGRFLEPLLPLRRLERVTLELSNTPPRAIFLQDEDIRMMADSWPSLQSLRIELNEGHPDTNFSGPSLYSLSQFATKCHRLVRLELPYLQSDIQMALMMQLVRSARSSQPHGLRHLHVHHLVSRQPQDHFTDLAMTVIFLGITFPNLALHDGIECIVLHCCWSMTADMLEVIPRNL